MDGWISFKRRPVTDTVYSVSHEWVFGLYTSKGVYGTLLVSLGEGLSMKLQTNSQRSIA